MKPSTSTKIISDGSKIIQQESKAGSLLTKTELQAIVPKSMRSMITARTVRIINAEPDEETRRIFKSNALTYARVMLEGQYSPSEYLIAIKFVSKLLVGATPLEAYISTFSTQYEKHIKAGKSINSIRSKAILFKASPIVQSLFEQAMVPVHLMYSDVFHKAIQKQVSLMTVARSEAVQQKAAECLMAYLKPPEKTQLEIEVMHKSSIIEDLEKVTNALAQKQKELIKNRGYSAKRIAESTIIEAEVIED
jgi:hypothetical protein